jgi:hypothetical protein
MSTKTVNKKTNPIQQDWEDREFLEVLYFYLK